MKVLLLLAAMNMAFVPMQIHGSLMNFAKMVEMTTGKSYSISYVNYGCYCRYSGNGSPKDVTDRCCFVHDCCYYDLEKHGCDPIFLNYEFTSERGIITCAANQDSCMKVLCQCDKAAAECFGQNLRSYNKKYRHYPDMLCDGKPPKC